MNKHTFDAVLPERVYAVGTHCSSEIAIPSGHSRFEIRIGVAEHLDPDTEIAVGLDISLDGGRTWQAGGAAGRSGGPGSIDRTTGLQRKSMSFQGGLGVAETRGRAGRVRVSVRGHATTLGPVDLLVSDEAIGRRGPALA